MRSRAPRDRVKFGKAKKNRAGVRVPYRVDSSVQFQQRGITSIRLSPLIVDMLYEYQSA